jgi:hypothetical protein
MGELIIDFITSLDGYASAEGWPGWWGLEGPEYLRWLDERPESTLLMGANTYRLMSGFAAGATPEGIDEFPTDEKNTSPLSPQCRKWCSPPASMNHSPGRIRPSCATTPSKRCGR